MFSVKKIVHLLLAWSAYWRYGRPARKLIVVGVTGTKGKTTASRLIASALEAGGNKVGLLSTVEFQVGARRWLNDKKMTMLGRGQIQSLLRDMVRAGCTYAVVETSSEGILQWRHYGLLYDICVFTNLGTEHQERHGGFENLRRDKGKIFAQLANTKRKIINGKKVDSVIVANTDDQNADFYLQFGADKKVAFGLQSRQRDVDTILAKNVASTDSGVSFEVQGTQFNLHIIGEFNVYNALAAIGVAQSQGISYSTIASGLASVSLVEGRMEEVRAGQDFKVIVDYAHEPLSFTELFKSLRQLVGANKKIIAVIGSDGGGRDVGKREKMGEIAGLLTDRVVVTDVNCYEEDPLRIAEMLAVGARKIGKKDGENLFVEVDRRAAIAKAISMAEAGDVVVITAKGTEPYIAVAGGKKIPWDDRLVAKEILLSK
jgi:UDP-N-acetylmuramoyl-L-alanyl-D-glutamate--2,6-diaminopimelate ligase